MPTFQYFDEEIDISVDEFLSECDKKQKLLLYERLSSTYKSISESIFEKSLLSLHGKYFSLTKEEEETIIKIAKRFV